MTPGLAHLLGRLRRFPLDDRREGIERLFAVYSGGVGSYVLARVGNRAAAESITSRVFVTVAAKFGECRSSPEAWLWAIVRSEVARHFRDRRIYAPLNDDLVDPAESPLDAAAGRETAGEMQEALAQLSEEHQQLIYMKFFQAMSNVEIATATGLSASNVGVLVHRALKQLRDLMETAEVSNDGRKSGR